ncbi:MAG TPA: DUF692 family protein [Anaerolineae bacterium]|nr:DUF692 family protein [Anaerolineae bacterium]
MIQLTTDVSDSLLELLREDGDLIDAAEVGPWFSVEQVRRYRQALPELPFHFHGADLIERVGLIPGTVSKIAAYLHYTRSPWASMHITMWLPGMVGLMLRRGWRMPLPHPEQATQRFIQRVRRLVHSIHVPVILENTEPPPFKGYDFEVQPQRITQVLEETGCGFLLDIGHARISAARLGMEVDEYLGSLPLKRVVQVHVSGPRLRAGCLVDAHEPLQEVDYAVLDFVLERTKPQAVTLEYIREREPLREQLFRLRGMLDTHHASLGRRS